MQTVRTRDAVPDLLEGQRERRPEAHAVVHQVRPLGKKECVAARLQLVDVVFER
jgi:hypothetical protein